MRAIQLILMAVLMLSLTASVRTDGFGGASSADDTRTSDGDRSLGLDSRPELIPGKKIRVTLVGRLEASSLFGGTKRREEGIYLGSSRGMLGVTHGEAVDDTLWIDKASIIKLEMSHGEEAHPFRGAAYGMVAGFFGGLVAAAIETESCQGEFLCGVSYIVFPPAGALGGLFIGAIVGAFAKTEGWMEVPERDYDIGFRLQPGGRTEVGVKARF